MFCRRRLPLITAMLVAFQVSQTPVSVSADQVVYEAIEIEFGDPEPTITGSGTNITQGWGFIVEAGNLSANEKLRVTELGIYDEGSDGLSQDHAVGIWDADKTLLGSVIVPSASVGTLVGSFRYKTLDDPFLLEAGQTYAIGAHYSSSDDQLITAGGFNTGPHISRSGARNSGSSSNLLLYPDSSSSGGGRFGPNFRFTVVPEPSSLVLASLLVIGTMAGVWRKKKV